MSLYQQAFFNLVDRPSIKKKLKEILQEMYYTIIQAIVSLLKRNSLLDNTTIGIELYTKKTSHRKLKSPKTLNTYTKSTVLHNKQSNAQKVT